MGASISCALFENLSTALHWLTETRTGNRDILHYLVDFLLGGEADSTRCKDTLLEFTGVKRVMEGAVGKTQNYRTDCLPFWGLNLTHET